jgi:hypothetical protein
MSQRGTDIRNNPGDNRIAAYGIAAFSYYPQGLMAGYIVIDEGTIVPRGYSPSAY